MCILPGLLDKPFSSGADRADAQGMQIQRRALEYRISVKAVIVSMGHRRDCVRPSAEEGKYLCSYFLCSTSTKFSKAEFMQQVLVAGQVSIRMKFAKAFSSVLFFFKTGCF